MSSAAPNAQTIEIFVIGVPLSSKSCVEAMAAMEGIARPWCGSHQKHIFVGRKEGKASRQLSVNMRQRKRYLKAAGTVQ
ncbi:hypothetical protein [Dyella silvae]|uniref:hypothetical protein n=1 Tax=Dyella silvae TaxID=2994424 RepID=UPI002264368C|nr:hypothetical protein [Dyella silvae]